METEPGVHTVRVDLYKLEALGLYQRPLYEPCPIKIDKKALKHLQSVPTPSGNTIKVDLNRMEELGIYQRPLNLSVEPWYRRIHLFEWFHRIIDIPKKLCRIIKWPVKKFRIPEMSLSKRQIYMAAGIAASAAMGICIVFCVNVNSVDENTQTVSVVRQEPIDENTVAITYIDDVDFSNVGQLDLSTIGQLASNVAENDISVTEQSVSMSNTEQYEIQTEEMQEDVQSEIPETEDTSNVQETLQEEEFHEQESEEEFHEPNSEEESHEQESEEEFNEQESEEDEYLLAVANVEDTLNVRVEASEDSEKAGLMYKDCVGTILEQKDGWTKLESGALVGWANDEYLLFDDDAKAIIEEVENSTATVEAVSLHVRQEPNVDATVVGYVNEGDTLTVVDIDDNNWAEIEYKDSTAYVNTKYMNIGSGIKTGETIEEIEKREQEEAEAKRKQEEAKAKKREQEESEAKTADIVNVENVTIEDVAEQTAELAIEPAAVSETTGAGLTASQEDTNKIAAMIYCEAGNQSYEGQVAVGAIIVNRVNSPKFPNTVEEVLRAPKQFSPVKSGKYDRVYSTGSWSSSCYQAALDAIAGEKGLVADCFYFKNPKIAGAHKGINIGDHVFW